jgi:RND family efflux transporter MFP subunit
MNWNGTILGLLVAFVLCVSSEGMAQSGSGIEAVTAPSADLILSFVQPGCVAGVHIKYGDTVKAGQILIQQDDSVERVQLERLLAESSNTTDIDAAIASLEQKKVDLRRIEEAARGRAATDLEVEHARLDVKIAELTVQAARFEHEQAKRRYTEAAAALQRMVLRSPVEGRVEKIHVEAGESVNALDEAIRIVRTDPLWIDVAVPMEDVSAVRLGDFAQVFFPSPGRTIEKGVVVFIGAVADAASGTLNVRIEVPNKANRPAGEQVRIVLAGADGAGDGANDARN